MKQTSIEWLEEKAKEFVIDLDLLTYFEQAKEMHKQQQDEFAIGFAKWILTNCWLHDDEYWELVTKSGDIRKSEEELLEIYKKENNL